MRKFGMLKKYHFGLNLHLRGLVLASLVAEGLVGVSKLLLHHACTNKIIAPRNDSGGVLVFECKWVTMERERNGLLWRMYDGLLWQDGIW